jgi:O-methyltransferase involved in polyketide biosynthesis/GNAT superfamily N-acetyltransferase
MTTTTTRDPIIQTAFDALLAKYASLEAGYEPIPPFPSSSEETSSSTGQYREFLHTWLYGNSNPEQQQVYPYNNKPSVQHHRFSPRLQSPLVHAGYAIRLATIQHTLDAFMKFHGKHSTKLQLVILGCGLDTLGLWTLITNHYLGEGCITVYDLDKPHITKLKKEMLLEQNLLYHYNETDSLNEEMGILCKGWISKNSTAKTNTPNSSRSEIDFASDVNCNYYLGSCDLRKINSVSDCLSTLDPSIPTLVISELVLTYLGQSGMENLLSYCANQIAVAPGSAMVALEPLGPNTKEQQKFSSTWEEYKQQYCQFFVQKLSKRFARWDSTEYFFPPGPTISVVERRFQSAGFHFTFATSMGHAVTSLPIQYVESPSDSPAPFSPIQFHPNPKEPFDEHAALALHVRSYVLVVAFTASRPYPDLLHMIRYLCPWSSVTKKNMEALQVGAPPQIYTIRIIQSRDHDAVRNLYSQTYEYLFEEYPSVRKLVKTALHSDLRCDPEEHHEFTDSSIALRYSVAGGVFLVAVDPHNENILFGCIGIQPYLPTRSVEGKSSLHNRAYEIRRFAVCSNQRGKGLGKLLIDIATTFVRGEKKLEGECIELLAKTPAVLEAANNLYRACTFHLDYEETMGTMVIRTYKKLIL